MDICNKIISKTELKESKDLLIEFKNQAFLIYSPIKYSITDIINLFQNLQIEITDTFSTKYKNTYLYKLFTNLSAEEFYKNKSNLIEIITKALNKEIYTLCKLYFFILKGFNFRKIELLRAIIKYQTQLVYEFNEKEIIETLIKNPEITTKIVTFFEEKFKGTYPKGLEKEIKKLISDLKEINSYKIVSFFFTIIQNTLRTNYFLNKETIALKIYTQNFKSMLFGMQPNIEAFVYHIDFNGIHLRMSKISRGGIRYSNRKDFREEVKELVITQEAKNALIIPEGAKGGFYIFKSKDVKKYYSLFIDALLDLVDSDVKVKKYDDKDFYFVVAADRGTSNLSDVANEIAIKRNFFLKDAFASGGKTGYSHKALGVTAKGAIKSTSRFFKEIGKDLYKDKISVVGVGSMRGDVFGNGMLINKNFLLKGAISHKEIFIDPNPDPEIAYKERKRLFENSLSWSEYNKDLISKGGGVFSRNEKEIKLSPEIKEFLNIKEDIVSADFLAKKLLSAKVDLLYFGGIGTYVKSSEEENIHISDKANENIRIDAKDIKAFAVCEGANLAFTMKARFEYALSGGKINLDSIDNSAGVNTSDYEVNLKIILNSLVEKGKLTEEEKVDILLNQIKDEVLDKVFFNNYSHALLLSLDQIRMYKEKFIKIVEILETTDYFKRHYYHLPKNSEIENLFNPKIIRPALAIIMLYSKIFLKKYILNNLEFSDYHLKFLKHYFPKTFYKKFENEILNHPLKKEIITTSISNFIINNNGIGFLADYHKDKLKHKINSYLIITDFFNIHQIIKVAN